MVDFLVLVSNLLCYHQAAFLNSNDAYGVVEERLKKAKNLHNVKNITMEKRGL